MTLNVGYWNQSIAKTDMFGDEYCFVPSGAFYYGRDKSVASIPAPFCMAKFPVTNVQFKKFVVETGYDYNLFDVMEQLAPEPGCPATPISWQNAKAYARWCRSKTGEYYCLPSEEEWEAAARGTDGRLYPWGNTLPSEDYLATPKHQQLQTTVVGTQTSNVSPYGCMDMVGGVWEWCLDEIDDLGEAHIMRGGSCINCRDYCNCNVRCYDSPSSKRVLYAGFRLLYLSKDMYETYRAAIERGASGVTVQ